MAKLPSVAQVCELGLAPAETITLKGALRTLDGATLGPAELFDFGAGGLRLTGDDAAEHAVRLEASGLPAPACEAAHVRAPCLAPKLTSLARAHLLTPQELASTLTGDLEIDRSALGPPAPEADAPAPYAGVSAWGRLGAALDDGGRPLAPYGAALAVTLALAVALGLCARAIARRRPLFAVLHAARAARRAARKDATLAEAHAKIGDLVLHARTLDRVRRDCAARRRAIDPRALAAGLAAEREEAARLGEDLARATADLARVASALRLVAMQAREGRGAAPASDPVAELTRELVMRDEALAELELLPRR